MKRNNKLLFFQYTPSRAIVFLVIISLLFSSQELYAKRINRAKGKENIVGLNNNDAINGASKAFLGTTGTVTITPSSIPGDNLTVTVTDNDLDTDINVAETVVIQVKNDVTSEIEDVTLTETGVNTGVFEAALATIYGESAGTSNDGTLNTKATDTVIATYDDVLDDSDNDPAAVTASSTVEGGVTGAITITPSSIPGDNLTVTVTDNDLNIDNGVAETVIIQVKNNITSEIEDVTLTETGVDTGIFEGTLATIYGASAGTNNDGTINTKAADTLTATYDDALDANGANPAAILATGAVNGGATGTISITQVSLPGDNLTVTVTDNDLNVDTGVVDTVLIIVKNDSTGESENLNLAETGANTGIFEATVNTVYGTVAGTNNDGVFNTKGGDTITATYDDALDANGNNPVAITAQNQVKEKPVAKDDTISGLVTGNDATVNVLNDNGNGPDTDVDGTLDASRISLIAPPTATNVTADAEGDTISFIITGEGSWSVDNSGVLTFSPESGFTTDPTSIKYNVRDNDGYVSNDANVTLDYAAQNPVAKNDLKSGLVTGSTATLDVLADNGNGEDIDPDGNLEVTRISLVVPTGATLVQVDAEGDTTGFAVTGEGVWSVNETTGLVSFEPATGFTGDPTPVNYTVRDNDGNVSNEATITLDYDAQNPIAKNDLKSGLVTGSTATLDVLADNGNGEDTDPDGNLEVTRISLVVPTGATLVQVDAEGDTIGFTVTNEGVWSVNETTGLVSFAPATGFTGDPTPVNYRVRDNDGNVSNEATITLDYDAQNPIAKDDLKSGLVTGSTATLDVLADNGNGEDTDPDGNLEVTRISLVAPTEATSVQVDAEGDTTGFTVTGEGVWSVNETTGLVSFAPATGFTGDPTPVNYTVRDNDGNVSNAATITLDYDAQNPITKNDLKSGLVTGSTATLDVLADNGNGEDADPDGNLEVTRISLVVPIGATLVQVDAEGDTIGFTVTNEGVWSVNETTGLVSFAPATGFTGDPTPVNYTVRDNDGNVSNEATITLDYDAQNPITKNDLKSGLVTGSTATLDVLADNGNGEDTDPDGNLEVTRISLVAPTEATSVQVDAEGDTTGFTVTGEGVWSVNETTGLVSFAPATGFTGDPTPVNYTVRDNDGNVSNAATITLDYEGQNPVAVNDTKNATVGAVVTINVTANDTDNVSVEETTVSITTTGATDEDSDGDFDKLVVSGEGTWLVDATTGVVTFTPDSGLTGNPTVIKYTVKDDEGNLSNEATIAVNYSANPVAVDDTVSATVGSPAIINVTANDTDADGSINVTTVNITTEGATDEDADGDFDKLIVSGEGIWTVDATTGSVTFTPESSFTSNPTTITYNVKDNDGNLSNAATINANYTTGPVAVDDTITVNSIGTSTVNVVENDTDADGTVDTATVNLIAPPTATNIVTDSDGDTVGFKIEGEGTWSVNEATGVVTFIPESGILSSPTPISYNVKDNEGNQSNTAVITINYTPMDSDGDGVLDATEITNNTDPSDACDYNVADITEAVDPNKDCDNDGIKDINEINGPDGDPNTADGSNPLDADSDDDGVLDGAELANGTDYNDACKYKVESITSIETINTDKDCDNDGLKDIDEIKGADGNPNTADGTDPFNPDSDGDGITDKDEVTNGTDPNDPCDPTACIGDSGTIEITEFIAVGDKLTITLRDKDLNAKPTEVESFTVTSVNEATGEIETVVLIETGADTGVFVTTLKTKSGIADDTDNNGIFNVKLGDTIKVTYDDEFGNTGDNPEPVSDISTVIENGDTDGDGVPDAVENQKGTDPNDSCSYNIADISVAITDTTKDCDNDGLTDVEEINGPDGNPETNDGSDPKNPDSDGDGVKDGTEKTNGTDINDSCSYNVADITETITTNKDCDGDGLTDKEEVEGPDGDITTNDGTDPKKKDTDGDGVTDGDELKNGTNPNDTCDYNIADITEEMTSGADCDSDGLTDKEEIEGPDGDPTTNDGTDPKKSDTDDDGINDGDEVTAGSDPNDPCDPNTCVADTGAINVVEYLKPGDQIIVTVVDTDLNIDTTVAETIQIQALNDATGEIETVTLTETGPDTGIFEGTVNTTLGGTADTDNTGTFNVKPGDTVTVTYNDAKDNQGNGPTALKDTVKFIDFADTDGDGVFDSIENDNGTDPNDACSYNISDIQTEITSDADCDNDGLTEKEEVEGPDGDITTNDGTDPKNPDTDGDGVKDGTEVTNGTNPNEECDYNVADITETIISIKDCDNDGISDVDEINGPDGDATTNDGTDPKNPDTDGDGVKDGVEVENYTDPLDECDYNVVDVTETILANKDCDGDGLKDKDEIVGPDGNPNTGDETDPKKADTDGDGINDGDEITGGSNPLDPCDPNPCDGATGTLSITDPSSPGDTLTITLKDKDLDTNTAVAETFVVQVINQVTGEVETVTLTETGLDTGVFVGTLNTVSGSTAGTNNDGVVNTKPGDTLIVTYDDAKDNQGNDPDPISAISHVYTNVDTDGDGVLDAVEVASGTDPKDACDYLVSDISNPITSDNDCDGDGLSDKDEINGPDGDPSTNDGTNPKDIDTDDDGVIDGKEVTSGTDPKDGCSYNSEDIDETLTINPARDCDNDGLTDIEEINGPDGDPTTDDGTDPKNPDTDGDGVTDGDEKNSGTVATDPCSYSQAEITLEITSGSDCDGDGLSDRDEINTHNTDPKSSDSDEDGLSDGEEITQYKTDPNNVDTDGDGVMDGTEISSGTNPKAPCDYKETDITLPVSTTEDCGDRTVVNNVITPNDDGDNDKWIIKNIQEYPNNTVKVYNRWGIMVYETTNYGASDNYFVGSSDGRITMNKEEELPEGTYYYVIEFTDEVNNKAISKSGYLYIQR